MIFYSILFVILLKLRHKFTQFILIHRIFSQKTIFPLFFFEREHRYQEHGDRYLFHTYFTLEKQIFNHFFTLER